VDAPHTGILVDYLPEPKLAAELGHCARTLARWRALRIGPPFTMSGKQVLYNVEAVRQWLAAGGTAGVRDKSRRHKG
jgi:hypothetical protein